VSKKNTKKKSLTDWEKIDGIADEDIDFSDIPELDDDFFKNARIVLPKPKIPITLRVEPDVLEWYKSTGEKYQTLMHAVLKEYARTAHAPK
jgi:uncharacterized protein (DUF4415 family)